METEFTCGYCTCKTRCEINIQTDTERQQKINEQAHIKDKFSERCVAHNSPIKWWQRLLGIGDEWKVYESTISIQIVDKKKFRIIEQHNKIYNYKYIQCPICHSKTYLPIERHFNLQL